MADSSQVVERLEERTPLCAQRSELFFSAGGEPVVAAIQDESLDTILSRMSAE
jgi:hypothetical protein